MQSAISNGLLEPAATSATKIQKIVIFGTLNVDISFGSYTFAEGSIIIFKKVTPIGGGLNVPAGKTLILQGTTVVGCGRWDSIYANSGSSLIVQNSHISEGGVGALSAAQGASISINGNSFKRNVVAISLGEGALQGSVNFTPGGNLTDNVIDGTFSPNGNIEPIFGIYISRVDNFLVGGSGLNTIQNFGLPTDGLNSGSGIVCTSSSVTIRNTRFLDVGLNSKVEGLFGSGCVIAEKNSTVSLFGLGKENNNLSTIFFSNAANSLAKLRGVWLKNSNGTISQCKIEGCRKAIEFLNQSTENKNLIVDNCSIKNYKTSGIEAVSPLGTVLKLSQFKVTNTLFDDSQPASSDLNTAILVQNNGSLPVNGSSYFIESNTFFQRPKAATLGPLYRGVFLQSVEGAKCRNNTFTNQHSVGVNSYAAIRISNCRKLEIASNIVNGINAPDNEVSFAFEKESGISVEDAPENKITCNVMNNVAIGMDFRNISSSTNLGENTFNNSAKFGLKLKEGAVIGAQNRRSNIWPTSSSAAEAFMEFVDFDPNNTAHTAQVFASRFTINSTSTNSSQFANPNIVGADVTTGNPNSGWFKLPISAMVVLSQCGPTSPPGPGPGGVNESEVIDERETKIIQGEVFPYKGYAANAWEAEFNLFLRLASTPELTLSDADANNWFSQKSSTKIGNFANVYRGISTQINPDWVQLKYQLASQLAAITPNAQYESDLKSVMEICVNHLTDTIGFTDSEQITLVQIADKCRFEGGLAVILARTALGQSSYRASECSGAWPEGDSEERNTIAQNSKLKVYPNPTQDFLNIEGAMITTGERSFFRLYDVAGNLILEERIIHSSQTINLSSVANGLYIATIINNQGIIERQKLVINK